MDGCQPKDARRATGNATGDDSQTLIISPPSEAVSVFPAGTQSGEVRPLWGAVRPVRQLPAEGLRHHQVRQNRNPEGFRSSCRVPQLRRQLGSPRWSQISRARHRWRDAVDCLRKACLPHLFGPPNWGAVLGDLLRYLLFRVKLMSSVSCSIWGRICPKHFLMVRSPTKRRASARESSASPRNSCEKRSEQIPGASESFSPTGRNSSA